MHNSTSSRHLFTLIVNGQEIVLSEFILTIVDLA